MVAALPQRGAKCERNMTMRLSVGVVALAAGLTLVSCKAGAPTSPTEASSTAPAVAASAAATAIPTIQPSEPAAAPRHVKVSNDLYVFEYSYPAAAAAIPALKAYFDSELDRQRAQVARDARAEQADAKGSDYEYHAHESGQEWKVVTDLPGWLSLSSLVSSYTGGAHPNYGYAGLLWDKGAGRAREVSALFTSDQALSAAIRRSFCAALDRQRAEKRGGSAKLGSGDEFDACLDPLDSTVILGSSNHQTFDRIGVLVAPYEAGPYAEGGYEVTVPVTPAVIAALKPEYRAAFAAGQ
jgi:hypothetical protein